MFWVHLVLRLKKTCKDEWYTFENSTTLCKSPTTSSILLWSFRGIVSRPIGTLFSIWFRSFRRLARLWTTISTIFLTNMTGHNLFWSPHYLHLWCTWLKFNSYTEIILLCCFFSFIFLSTLWFLCILFCFVLDY